MADDITNTMLLGHMQAMKNDLQTQITDVKTQITDVKTGVRGLTEEMRQGFAEAGEHRQALQEDLEAAMRMLAKHQEKLARIKVCYRSSNAQVAKLVDALA